MINWLITLKQIKTYPEAKQLAAFQPYLRDLGDFQQADYWRRLPWLTLLQKPDWSETFLYIMKQLLDMVAQMDSEDEELQSALERLGFPEGACAAVEDLQREALSAGQERDYLVAKLQLESFEEPCGVTF